MFWVFIHIYIKGKLFEFDLIHDLIKFVCKNNKDHTVSNVTKLQEPQTILELKTIKNIHWLIIVLLFVLYIMGHIIKTTYEEHFGTAYETYKQSVKQIQLYKTYKIVQVYKQMQLYTTIQDVKDCLSKRDDVQVTSKPKTYNSFVSPGAKLEFEIDIMDMETTDATSNTYPIWSCCNC